MKHLLSPEGEAALALTMSQRPLLAFDFDGTLAPIVARPDDARVPMPVITRLKRLSQHFPIAIISGRGVDDVRSRLDFEPTYIIGNHGAEDPVVGDPAPASDLLGPLRQRLAARADAVRDAGIWTEDKGASLALHYRLARDRQHAVQVIDEVLVGLEAGLKTFGGKLVVNVVSSQANDKAQALDVLVRRCQVIAAVFVGDDVNDEPVFARGDPSWLTVRVGREDPGSRAQYFLDSSIELPLMLDCMLATLPAEGL